MNLSELIKKYGNLENKPALSELYWEEITKEVEDKVRPSLGDIWVREIKPIMKRYDIRGKIAIDAGCGLGQKTPYLVHYFGQVYGFDFCEHRIQWARDHFSASGVDFMVHNLVNEMPVQGVDYLQTITVLQHMNIGDKCRALLNIRACLADGGIALFREGRIRMGSEMEEDILSAKQKHMFSTPVSLFENVFGNVTREASSVWMCKKS